MIRYIPKSFRFKDRSGLFVYENGAYKDVYNAESIYPRPTSFSVDDILQRASVKDSDIEVVGDENVLDLAAINNSDLETLAALAVQTKESLETAFSRRGWTTGLKKWERQLLFLAYESMSTPKKDRRFGLDKIDDVSKIERGYAH